MQLTPPWAVTVCGCASNMTIVGGTSACKVMVQSDVTTALVASLNKACVCVNVCGCLCLCVLGWPPLGLTFCPPQNTASVPSGDQAGLVENVLLLLMTLRWAVHPRPNWLCVYYWLTTMHTPLHQPTNPRYSEVSVAAVMRVTQASAVAVVVKCLHASFPPPVRAAAGA